MEDIRKLIEESGLKKKFIAAKLGIHPAYLSQILSETVPLTDKVRARIMDFFKPDKVESDG